MAGGDRMDIDVPGRWGLVRPPSAGRTLSQTAALALLAAVLAPPARADGPPPPPATDLWQRDKLSGDWNGARTGLSNRGVDITINYIGETLAMVSGGFRQGVDYEHRFELSIDTDLDKLLGWKGATTKSPSTRSDMPTACRRPIM